MKNKHNAAQIISISHSIRKRNSLKLFINSLLCFSLSFFFACNTKMENTHTFKTLTDTIAAKLIEMPMKCVNQEFPNKLNQSLDSLGEMGRPAELHPAFYGCYDWHSSVHGHWMMLILSQKYPHLPQKEKAMQLMLQNITPEKMARELAYFQRKSEKSFERTYGWAWYLKLTQTAKELKTPEGAALYQNLKPLAEELSHRYQQFLPKLVYPIRAGEHPNTAFGLSFAYDYAVALGDDSLKQAIILAANRLFLNDKKAPLSWEPSGFDFLSPSLEEASLMCRILSKKEYIHWLSGFLPQLSDENFDLKHAEVLDRADGKLAHLDGLNFSRAWCLYRIAKIDKQFTHLKIVADKHIRHSLGKMNDGNYSGDHWLGSFATLALLEAGE